MTKLKHEFRMASYGMLVGSGDTVADDYYTRYIKDKFRKVKHKISNFIVCAA
jgi:hypothetical protein